MGKFHPSLTILSSEWAQFKPQAPSKLKQPLVFAKAVTRENRITMRTVEIS